MNRKRLYALLQNGQALSSAQLAEMTGLPLRTVQDTLGAMRDRGLVSPTPVTYRLTDEGESLAKKRLADVEDTSTFVRSAMASQPALAMFWR